VVAIAQLGLELRDGPVASEAAEAKPAEDVPGNEPPGQSDHSLGQGAEGAVMSGAGRVRAVSQFADQFKGALEGKDAVEAMVADMQMAVAEIAGLLLDAEDVLREDGIRRPGEAHRFPSRDIEATLA
jgi:hypothetical protein